MAFVFDFVMEALVLLPTGLYTYPGAIRAVSFNAGTYYQWPIYEGLMWGGVQTALCCLRFFTDDRGRTIVERGLDQCPRRLRPSSSSSASWRSSQRCSACFFVFYNIPAQWIAMHSDPWPEDHLKRSYFNGGICGDGTEIPCPDPSLPLPSRWSGYINTDGELVLPEGKEVPRTVPFERGE